MTTAVGWPVMRTSGLLISVAFLLAAHFAFAGQAPAPLKAGTELNATLTAPIDSGAVKPGAPVTAVTLQDVRVGGVVTIPKGSKLVGRVTHATRYRPTSAAGPGANAELGIIFHRALISGGRELAIETMIGALAPEAPAGGALQRYGGMVGVPGVTPIGSGVKLPGKSPGAVGGLDSSGRLKPGSRGVFGIENLDVSMGLVMSSRTTVSLESGTQLLLVAGGDKVDETEE